MRHRIVENAAQVRTNYDEGLLMKFRWALVPLLFAALIVVAVGCGPKEAPTPTRTVLAPNYHKIVSPGWVADLIAGGNPGTADSPPTYPGKGYVILETMSFKGGDKTDEYDSGHIPGALHLNCYAWEGGYPRYPYTNPDDGNKLPDALLQRAIEGYGISWDKTVVVYHEGTGTGCAARVAWMLMYAGVEDVRLLNGGKQAWRAYGGALETTPNRGTPVPFGATVPLHPEYLATTADVRARMGDPTAVLADVRTWEQFIGAPGSNTYTHFRFNAEGPVGRIPGAIWLPSDYLNADGTFRSYAELEKIWRDQGQGVTPDKKLAFY